MPVFCYCGCLCLTATDAHTLLPWMPILCYHGCLYPATTDARTLLPRMPVFHYHGFPYSATMDAHILLPWMPATLALAEGGNSTNSVIGPSRLVATASCFLLPHLDASLGLLPSSYYFGDPRFTSLRHFTPNILGIAAHLGSSSHRSGPLSEPGPLRGLRPNSYLHLTNANILLSNAAQ